MKKMTQFRKKSLVVEAVQWTGKNFDEIKEFLGKPKSFHNMTYKKDEETRANDLLGIPSTKGFITAFLNDWITKEFQREFYVYKPDMFLKTHKKV